MGNPAVLRFLDLPDEVIVMILNELYELQSGACNAVLRTSQRLYELALPLVYQTITLRLRHFFDPDFSLMCNETSASFPKFRQMQKYTRSVTIRENLSWRWFVPTLEKLNRLEMIKWVLWDDQNISDAFVSHLREDLPHVHLLVEDGTAPRTNPFGAPTPSPRRGRMYLDTYRSLKESSNLRSLTITWDHFSYALSRLIRSSPNLRFLHIHGYRMRMSHGLHHDDDDGNDKAEERDGKRPLAFLEELSLDDYDWDDSLFRPIQLKRLRRLELRGGNIDLFFDSFPHSKVSLETVMFQVAVEYDSADLQQNRLQKTAGFLCNFKGLRNLYISSVHNVASLLPAISIHGETLQELTIYERGKSDDRKRDRCAPMSSADLRMLNQICPFLTSLTLDIKGIQRNSQERQERWRSHSPPICGDTLPYAWDYAVLDALASFRKLRHLTLLTQGDNTGVSPLINPSAGAIKEVFEYLRSRKEGTGLLTMQVFVEEPESTYPYSSTSLPRQRQDHPHNDGPHSNRPDNHQGLFLDASTRGKKVLCYLDWTHNSNKNNNDHLQPRVRDFQVEGLLRDNEDRKRKEMREAEERELIRLTQVGRRHPTPADFSAVGGEGAFAVMDGEDGFEDAGGGVGLAAPSSDELDSDWG